MQIFDINRAGNYITNGNIQNKDNSKEDNSYIIYDDDIKIDFNDFIDFRKGHNIDGIKKEHNPTNKYEQMMKEYQAVEEAMAEEVDRPVPHLF